MKRRSASSMALLAWFCLPAASSRAEDVAVHLVSATPAASRSGTLLVVPVVTTTSVQPRRMSISVPGDVTLSLPPGSYQLAAEVPGWWAAPGVARVGHESEVTLSFRRAGTVAARIEPPSARNVSVQFEGVEGGFSGEARCSAIEPDLVSCTMPEGLFQLRFGLTGHVPLYIRHVRVEARSESRIGRLRFIRGASLSGSLVSKEGDLRRARVMVTSASPSARNTMTVRPDENGFFIAGPLPAGECTIRGVENGLLSPELQVTIREGLEARLPAPLILAKPRRLTVAITPAVDPLGGSWAVRLLALDGERPRVASGGTATLAGVWNADNLPAGNYQLRIRPARGPVWLVRDVKVSDPLTVEHVAIEPVQFRGKVRIGDRPLQASLIFGGEHSVNPLPFQSDGNGEFKGYLPRPEGDTWDVTVQSAAPRVNVTLKARLERHESGEPASVSISVPAMGIEGIVVDGDGAPVKYALIRIMSQDGSRMAHSKTGELGEFALYGLSADRYSILAQGPSSESDVVPVSVSESDTAPASLRLELRPYRRWSGRVVTADGRPVAGARIDMVPVDVDVISVAPAKTNPDGTFSATLPSRTQMVDVRVAPPGFAWTTFRRPVTPAEITIVVDSRPANLNLDLDRGQDLQPFIWHAGSAFAAYGLLSGWSAQLDDSSPERLLLKVPQIEPGDYTICLRRATDFDFRTSAPDGRCRTVVLPPYGEASVRW